MEKRELKVFLAGLGVAGLLAGTTLMAGGCAKMGKSGCGGAKGDAQQAPAKGSCSGDMKPAAASPQGSCSGDMKPAAASPQGSCSGTAK